ncbi:Ubiquitin-conjugating enzyme E2 15 [Entophlyctis luteolus]|nr:Ubiquitin-conjugating enzyme E2 15 [Entophlyctis luteolus]
MDMRMGHQRRHEESVVSVGARCGTFETRPQTAISKSNGRVPERPAPAPAAEGQVSLLMSCRRNLIPSISPALLAVPYAELSKFPVQGFSAGLSNDSNVYEWELMIMGPEGTLYEGGFFKAKLVFPTDYPQMPPKMTFLSDIWHPNVYPNGEVCISILHAPGEDKYGYESSGERWLPIHTVETIVLSVISMLSSPNDESPANIEAAKQWREDEKGFKKRVQRCVRKSLED